jgi:hypothetical protein
LGHIRRGVKWRHAGFISKKAMIRFFHVVVLAALLFSCTAVFAQNHTVVVVFHNNGPVRYPGSSTDFTMTVQGYWEACSCWAPSAGLVTVPAVAPYHSVRVYLPVATSVVYTNVAWVKFAMAGAVDTGEMAVRLAGGNDSPISSQQIVDFEYSPRNVSSHGQKLYLLKSHGRPARIISK